MRRLTDLQKSAIKDALTHGELERRTAHDDFSPGMHRGQTIASLVDRGLFEILDSSYYGYPLKVKPTPAATWDIL